MFEDVREDGAGAALAWRPSAGSSPAALPLVVFLHDRAETAVDGEGRARTLFGPGPDVVAPQAARPCNPFQSDLRSVATYSGFSWYLGADPCRPEAASFGDALGQLELFLRATQAKTARSIVVAGEGQGAVLALTLTLFASLRFAGIVAIGAGLPVIDGWSPPSFALAGLDAVLVGPASTAIETTKALLEERGASVRLLEQVGGLDTWLQSRADSRTSVGHDD